MKRLPMNSSGITKRFPKQFRQKGTALIGLIVAMVMISSLGTGMVYLSTTSDYSNLFVNYGEKAYYLAESGVLMAKKTLRGYQYSGDDNTTASGKVNNYTFILTGGTSSITVTDDPTNSARWLIQSTGVVNSGSFAEARRMVTRRILKDDPNNPGSSHNTYVDNADPDTNTAGVYAKPNQNYGDGAWTAGDGDFTTEMVDGNTAMHITDSAHGGGNWKQDAVVGFEVTSANMPDFEYYWDAAEKKLSYMVQVKIRINPAQVNPAQDYYLAGISFRVQNVGMSLTNSYGVSYVRGKSGNGSNEDGIPDSLVPSVNTPMVILWKQNNSEGSNARTVLAYKALDNPTNLYITDSSERLKDWVTILVYVDEKVLTANSAKFSAGAKVNDIKVYIADQDSHGTGNSDPLDTNRLTNTRITSTDQYYHWPCKDINNTASTNDYFTLVQWSTSGLNSSVELRADENDSNAINTVIRSNTYTSPSTTWTDRPEIALHCFGTNSQYDYFDDFIINFPTSDEESTDLQW